MIYHEISYLGYGPTEPPKWIVQHKRSVITSHWTQIGVVSGTLLQGKAFKLRFICWCWHLFACCLVFTRGFVRMTCFDLFPSASTAPLMQNSSRMLLGIASNVDQMWAVVQVHCQQAQCMDLHRANRHKPCHICFGARGVLVSSKMQEAHEQHSPILGMVLTKLFSLKTCPHCMSLWLDRFAG